MAKRTFGSALKDAIGKRPETEEPKIIAAPAPSAAVAKADTAEEDTGSKKRAPRSVAEDWEGRNVRPLSILIDRKLFRDFYNLYDDFRQTKHNEGFELLYHFADAYRRMDPAGAEAIAHRLIEKRKSERAARRAAGKGED